jgi:hypothetical protein
VIKPLLFAVCFVFACASLLAQRPGWQPSPGHTQVPVWPGNVPDAEFGPTANTETAVTAKSPVAGRPWLAVEYVSRPTMTVYSPKGKNTGAAVVVFPGGGYNVLAIDLEGTEVCEWLTSKGKNMVVETVFSNRFSTLGLGQKDLNIERRFGRFRRFFRFYILRCNFHSEKIAQLNGRCKCFIGNAFCACFGTQTGRILGGASTWGCSILNSRR